MSQQTHEPSRDLLASLIGALRALRRIRFYRLRHLAALVIGAYTGLLRRIEDARTPVPVWDDPRVTAQDPDSEDLRGSGARRSGRILKLSTPKRA